MAMPHRALMRLLTPMLRSSLSKLNSRSVNSSTAFKSINLGNQNAGSMAFLHARNGDRSPNTGRRKQNTSRNSPTPQPFPSAPFPAAAHQQGCGSRNAHHGRQDLKDHHPVDAEERGAVDVRHLEVPLDSKISPFHLENWGI